MKRRPKFKLQVLQTMQRRCDGCTACCYAMGVPALGKQPAADCPHVVPDGCGCYETRPQACRVFRCMWLAGAGSVDERPDATGVVLVAPSKLIPGMPLVMAHAAWSGAFHTPAARALIDRLSAKMVVVLMEGANDTRRAVGPPEMVKRFLERAVTIAAQLRVPVR